MSKEYDNYLETHRANVRKGYEWLRRHLSGAIHKSAFVEGSDIELRICGRHDMSKDSIDEYWPYDMYFYGHAESEVMSKRVVSAFNKAWLMHIHKNPHHWQYWVLINDDPAEGVTCIPMDYEYIIEMICDWWSFSWEKGDLFEIFNWYDKHRDYIQLHKETRRTVEFILSMMERELDAMLNKEVE